MTIKNQILSFFLTVLTYVVNLLAWIVSPGKTFMEIKMLCQANQDGYPLYWICHEKKRCGMILNRAHIYINAIPAGSKLCSHDEYIQFKILNNNFSISLQKTGETP